MITLVHWYSLQQKMNSLFSAHCCVYLTTEFLIMNNTLRATALLVIWHANLLPVNNFPLLLIGLRDCKLGMLTITFKCAVAYQK